MKEYNKLIRNHIPEIIENAEKEYEVKKVEGEEFFQALQKKLQEEVEEYLQEEEVEELIDILEVVAALADQHGLNMEKLEDLRMEKKKERGGFDKKLILLKAEE
ncbi:nucleoside triphosphate pyrophosphohydrolase [Halarsenatibacter silvermanii]|uniref:Predicted house-cleaning noncanonical NTP pyrophosphatase, all-alpha NTP-PPase (MazG) superfamily n=1 Tax=Halarsenatibacter silvermanii TaxID=321763 RepID=A0A1G9IPG3_9FIRM|nr:nucleoside triphosphate pyrophosphohydrolase [Halarsenatibacter silvermanii]SDL26784.1 Predicted house-cleaning noncanonical NTP pyrophosphatase, all-alpha NTP-PPase (MazG) superfamily [Halarsenatibacter silvermanii]